MYFHIISIYYSADNIRSQREAGLFPHSNDFHFPGKGRSRDILRQLGRETKNFMKIRRSQRSALPVPDTDNTAVGKKQIQKKKTGAPESDTDSGAPVFFSDYFMPLPTSSADG